MAAIDLEAVRRTLLDVEDALREELFAIEQRASEEQPPGEVVYGSLESVADEAHLTVEREKDQSVKRTYEARLRNVQLALIKVRDGTYGVCDSCGQAIAPRRLQALPHATLCLACQSKVESSVTRTPRPR